MLSEIPFFSDLQIPIFVCSQLVPASTVACFPLVFLWSTKFLPFISTSAWKLETSEFILKI